MHGSMHLFLMQACDLRQSEFMTHSGRQPAYGSPLNSGKHVQTSFTHCVFAPQLSQGLTGFGNSAKKVKLILRSDRVLDVGSKNLHFFWTVLFLIR